MACILLVAHGYIEFCLEGFDNDHIFEEERPLAGYPLVDSPFAQSAFGSGEMVLKHGETVEELFFNQS